MSFTIKGKIYSIAKEYLFISITVLFLGVAGVLLPYLYGGIDNAKATTFSTPTLMSESAPGDSNLVKLKKINDVYYLTYKPSGEPLKISTSSDMSSWSAFSTVINGVGMSYDFGYYTNGGYYYLVFSDGFNASIIFATSSDAVTWSATSTIIADIDTDGYPIYLSAPAADNFLSLGYAFYDGVEITAFLFATSSDGVTWATSTVASNVLGPLGFVSDGSNLHALYDVFTDTNFNTSTEVYLEYAKSTDGGATWVTTTIGRTDYQFYFPDNMSTLELDNDGNPGIVYYKVDEISDFVWADEGDGFQWTGDGNVTTSLIYAKYSGSAWASSTIATFPLAIASTSFGLNIRPSLIFAENNEALFAGPANNFYPYLVTNTNTLDISQVTITQIDDKAVDGISGGGSAGLSLVFDTSTLSVGFAFVGADPVTPTDRDLFFTTSTVVVAPSAPTGLTATPSTTTQIDLTWNSVGGATSYILYRSTNDFTTTSTVTTTVLTSFSDTGRDASTLYYYKVVALNAIGTSVASASVNTTTPAGELPYDGNLPALPVNSKQKLVYINDVYYLTFASSTGGLWDIYITTSTNGVLGTWSEPSVVSSENIKTDDNGPQDFEFVYNTTASSFALAYTSTNTITYFSTSTDSVSWSTPVSGQMPAGGYFNFDYQGNNVLFVGKNSTAGMHSSRSSYSTNGGTTFVTSSVFTRDVSTAGDPSSGMLGAQIGNDGSLHMLFYSTGNGTTVPNQLIYASSTDNGVSWTDTTVGTEIGDDSLGLEWGTLNLDSNDDPGVLYVEVNDFVDGNATTTIRMAKRSTLGVWTTSTIYYPASATGVSGFPKHPKLEFVGSDYPLAFHFGNNYNPVWSVSTTTDPYVFSNTTVSSTVIGDNTSHGMVYVTSTEILALSYIDNAGQLYFATSSLSLPVAPEVAWDGSLSSIDYAGTNSYTRLIYANNQYYYYFIGYENGEYHVELTTSTSGVDGTWSSSEYVLDEAMRPSIDVDMIYPIYEIQYNASSSYFGLVAYVSSTDTMVFVTSSDGVTWGSQMEIYTAVDGDFSEWIVNMDFLEGTDLISIAYEFDKIAFSTDAGATWSTSTISAVNPDNDDFLGVGITAGPVLHAGYGSDGAFYYASSTDNGSTWTTTTIHVTTNGSSSNLNKFILDGNNRPSLLINDTQQGEVGAATSTMLFASRNDNGTWSTSTIGTNIYSFTDDVASSDVGFYGAKPYVVYYGTSNYADFAYSTSTASPFTFVLNQNIDSSNAVGEMSRISTTYDSANTTAAVAYVNDSGELRFVTSSVDLVGAVEGTTPTAPSGLSTVVATSSITISWTDASDDEDGFVIQQSTNGVDYSILTTVASNTTSTVISSLSPNTRYWEKVAAYNSYGTSTYTASNDDYTNPVAPGTPTVSNVSTSSLTLSWDDNLNGSNTEYYILYSDANFSITTATTTSITGLTPNTEYTFTVRAQYLSSSTLYTAYSASSTATTTVAVNSVPTVSALYPVFATDGSGLVTVTTTVSDVDGDTAWVVFEYSLDGGVGFIKNNLSLSASAVSGTPVVGGDDGEVVSNITNTLAGNVLTIIWDTQAASVTSTDDVIIHLIAGDSFGYGGAVASLAFTVDNAAPSAPTISTLTPSGPMITLGWDAVAGASTYTVSTTAGSATTTSGTSVTYMNLLTDVSYDFQVLATDAYSNSSDYSTVTSTYTTAYAPGQPTMSVSDTYNLIINENNNPSTVEYSICLTLDGLTCASASHYAQANGAIGGTVVWQSYEDWGGASGVSLTGGTYNVAYQFLTQARNSAGVTTTFSIASESTYTPANQASAPTIGTPTTSTLPITINVNSNPVATTYAVYNSTDGNYLDADGASTSTAVYSTTSTLGSSFAATGLSPNTAYEFTVIARNGDGVNATTSTASTETYTNPTVPTTVVSTANGQTSQIVTWSANSNGTGTVYELFNVTASSAIVTTTQTSYTVTGLTADTSYQYKVRAEYLGDLGTYTSYSSNSTAVSTDAVSTEVEMTLSTGASSTFQLTGQDSHTVTLDSISSGVATLSFASTPFSVSLSAGQSSNNTANSITITMNSVGASSASFSVSTYTPPSSSPSSGGGSPVVSNPPVVVGNHGLLINNGDDNTGTINVTLNISASNVTQVSISNSSDFTNASFVAYSNNYNWVLNPGNGLKTVYVKLRSSDGSTITISDTITLTSQATDQVDGTVCTLTPEQAYKSLSSVAVYYITPECTKRAFTNSYIYFTYFPTWSSVKITDKLSSIPNDTLGFMPYGPLYDPQYGALVKTVKDPKVYLLLNTEKYWITSESIFNSLNYHWNWIEDVDQRLLNKYTIGSEINYTDHHPNYTLVKYKNNNKVYRLEPGSAEATPGKPELYGQQVKRWITDEKTFNSLNFRWDRIVIINDAEVYEDGENLGTEVESVETTKYTFTSLLALGSTGEEVKRLQIRLQELGYLDKSIIPTTNFGPSTQQAVIKLQTEHNLTPALGYTGPGTRGVLNGK